MNKDRLLKQLGLNIKVERVKKQMTQEDIADAAGLDRSYISDVENGKRNISAFNLFKIAKALGINPGMFFQEGDFGDLK